MKTEAFSFTPSNQTETMYLDDDTLIPKGAVLFVSKDGADCNSSIGVDDFTNRKSLSSSYNTIKNTDVDTSRSLLAYENGVLKVKGYISSVAVGEVRFTFDNFDINYKICGLIIGE